MSSKAMRRVTIEELSDILEESEEVGRVDLGPTLLVRCRHSVMGDLIAVSGSEGGCAVIPL